MNYPEISREDYAVFHELANAYYREGEDAQTPQEEVDGFIRFLFNMVMNQEIEGCFAEKESSCIGFALWAVDTEDFPFSEIPGFGTILEIGLVPAHRGSGLGQEFVSFIEKSLRERGVTQCYVSAYGPAQKFWIRCGFVPNGKTAENGLLLMIKGI